MKPRVLVYTWEVMVESKHSGELERLAYPGSTPTPKQYSSLIAAEDFITRHWRNYRQYNVKGTPVIVRRGS